MQLFIITGLSGSGKSIALQTLEDLSYYCIDNLPVGMLKPLVEQMRGDWGTDRDNFAVGIDARTTKKELNQLPDLVRSISSGGIETKIIFLSAATDILIRRFHETRRKHPLSSDSIALTDALALERQLLEPLANCADLLIETSATNVHELRELIKQRLNIGNHHEMAVQFQSFGYKYGIPADADFLFDARCLPNPHWETNLRAFTGHDKVVIEFLEQFPDVALLRKQIIDFLTTWLPHFESTNRSYMNIAIGCTGGQHRSVYLINGIANHFAPLRRNVIIRHRELS